jgi:hypothetical protein
MYDAETATVNDTDGTILATISREGDGLGEFVAESLNIQEAKENEAPDAYLSPLFEAFGGHCGLNADWCTMAWKIGGTLDQGFFILDNEESGKTCTVVFRREHALTATKISELFVGSVDQCKHFGLGILAARPPCIA